MGEKGGATRETVKASLGFNLQELVGGCQDAPRMGARGGVMGLGTWTHPCPVQI